MKYILALAASLLIMPNLMAQEISEKPAPELSIFQIENTPSGLSQELSNQAKVIAGLDEQAKQMGTALCDEMAKNRLLDARIAKLEQKVSALIRITKLHQSNK